MDRFLILGAGVLALLIIWYIRRRKNRKPDEEPEDKVYISPSDEALQKLRKIHEERSWTKINAKAFYTDLTGILRRYLERQFNIEAEEMVSSEILDAIDRKSFTSSSRSKIEPVLRLSDYVKFAKYKPLPGDFEESLSNSIQFVEETRPQYKEGGDHA